MKITQVTLENFRAYRQKTVITFDDLTVIIGKNDIGKSTILEALDIFFGNRSLDSGDKNIHAPENENVLIGVAFKDFPESLVIDEAVPTSLESEYLLNQNGHLEIQKEYKLGSKVTHQTYLIANHPTNEELKDLLTFKITDLKKRASDLGIDKGLYDGRKSSEIREQIRTGVGNKILELKQIKIDEDGMKNIWDKLSAIMPIYALFQSDRANSDRDSEIQDPMKIATKEVLKELQPQLAEIQTKIEERIKEVAKLTVEKVAEMNKEIATNLAPFFPKEIKWDTLFSPTLISDGVPLSKRGSGVRRLVLINFFRAEAERKMRDKNANSVIYAIEEPETSQHTNWQIELVKALVSLSNTNNTQVIVTTHSPELARLIPVDSLRYIKFEGHPNIELGTDANLPEIAESLGVFPNVTEKDHDIKLIICVEGPTDVSILTHFFKLCDFDIDYDPRLLIIPLGGATLDQWVNRRYLEKLSLPEYHIYDNDVTKYQKSVDLVNARGDNSSARLTINREIENYIHPRHIRTIYGLTVDVFDLKTVGWQNEWKSIDVPATISTVLRELKNNGHADIRGEAKDTLKSRLGTQAFAHMTRADLVELDVLAEVEIWIDEIRGKIGAAQ